jgi:hypothetical protein
MESKFQQLASDCQVLIAITGNPAQGRFELAGTTEPVEDLITRADFVGLIGIAGLTSKVALAVELDEVATRALTQAFSRLMESAIDVAEYWLENDFKNPPLELRGGEPN